MIAALKADPFAWYRENDLKMPLWMRELAPTADPAKALTAHELMQMGAKMKTEPAAPPMAMPMGEPSMADMPGMKHANMNGAKTGEATR